MSSPSNPLPTLAAAASRRLEVTGPDGPRRWTSQRRRELETRIKELRAANSAGLSRREIAELLARDGLKVGRWMLRDLLGPVPARAKKAPGDSGTGDALPPG